MMTHYKTILTAGFAMFSMFFGSGNLVFPLLVGQESLHQYPMAILGFVITAVLVPFLGLIGMILFDGNYRAYFDKLGRVPAFVLIAIILMLIGPFGVVPRCITVAFGGFNLLMPSLSFELFSLFFCGIIIACIWTKSRIVDIIGLFLTPFKLGGIVVLILFGLWFGQDAVQGGLSSPQAFTNAVFKGYQTMDLMAAFFFSSAIVYYLRNHLSAQEIARDDNKTLVKMSIAASIMGALLLTIVYIGFIGLGAKYAPYLHDAQPEQLLVAIGGQALGFFAKPVIAAILAVGCLATAVILSTLFVDFLQQDLTNGRLNRRHAIFITMAITFAISLLGFSKLMIVLDAILSVAYPALIALAIMNIVSKLTLQHHTQRHYTQWAFWSVLAVSVGFKVLG
jgi:LIVCS family branched-chain amino acid:cation transporter